MPSVVVELTDVAGGGVAVAAATMCKLTGSCATATTVGPDTFLAAGETTATSVKEAAATVAGRGTTRRPSPLTALASISGAIAAILSAGALVARIACRLSTPRSNPPTIVTA